MIMQGDKCLNKRYDYTCGTCYNNNLGVVEYCTECKTGLTGPLCDVCAIGIFVDCECKSLSKCNETDCLNGDCYYNVSISGHFFCTVCN